MTKKHYEAIAKVIRENLYSINNANYYFDFISELCRTFHEMNDRFDSDKFRQKCQKEG